MADEILKIDENSRNGCGGVTTGGELRNLQVEDDGSLSVTNTGNVAHDAADSGNPIKIGGHATAADRTDVDESDRVDASFDLAGYLRTLAKSAGDVAHDSADSGNPVKIGGRARSTQISAVSSDDRSDLIMDLYGQLVLANHTWNTRSARVKEIDSLDQRYILYTLTHTNVANATPEFGYIPMNGAKGLTIHVENTGGTDTFDFDYEFSNEGTASTDDWIDCTTNGMTIIGGTNFQSDHFAAIVAGSVPVGFRYELTTAGGANDADFNVFIKVWY